VYVLTRHLEHAIIAWSNIVGTIPIRSDLFCLHHGWTEDQELRMDESVLNYVLYLVVNCGIPPLKLPPSIFAFCAGYFSNLLFSFYQWTSNVISFFLARLMSASLSFMPSILPSLTTSLIFVLYVRGILSFPSCINSQSFLGCMIIYEFEFPVLPLPPGDLPQSLEKVFETRSYSGQTSRFNSWVFKIKSN